MCLCIYGPRISRFTLQDATRLSDIFNKLSPSMIMSNLNTRSFTLGGIYPNLVCPTHVFFIFKTVTHFGRCPMLPIPPSNTKYSVDLYHALTLMSCDVLVHNALQSCHCSFIPCYIYDECYMCMSTHAQLPMHHLGIYIKKHTNSKYIIQFMPSYQYTRIH